MKRNLIILFSIILSSHLCSLQAQQIRLGIKIEPQYSWLSVIGDDSSAGEAKAGFGFGLTADNYFREYYAFTTGISLCNIRGSILFNDPTTWGLNGKDKQIDADSDVDLSIQYVEIPLGLKFLSRTVGYVKIFAQLGANNYFRIQALADVQANSIERNNANNEIGVYNIGYFIGGGVEYSLGGNTSFLAGINYSNGLKDITSNHTDDVSFGNVAFRLGIMF